MNARLASEALSALLSRGVTEYCVCPGARNAPLIAAIGANEGRLRARYFYDERSAAFFAVGRARASGRPVAIVTTSGTAAGECLPAAMEAHYSGVPLVLLTADRPRHYRGSGAPQVAEQVGIFGVYSPTHVDLAGAEPWPRELPWDERWPLHVNLCFDEPLLRAEDSYPLAASGVWDRRGEKLSGLASPGSVEDQVSRLVQGLRGLRRPLVVVAGLAPSEREAVRGFALELGAPVYLEGLSGLREDRVLQALRVRSGDRVMDRARAAGYEVDGVIRIGAIPTFRGWRDLEDRHASLPVYSVSALPFSGLGRQSHCAAGPIDALLGAVAGGFEPAASSEAFLAADRERQDAVDRLLEEEPRSEPGLFRALSAGLRERSLVYLGNSLPIREWDLAAIHDDRALELHASRGLNGIDGQVSTFLGGCETGRENWGIFGDLTALYDLSGPWALNQLEGVRANLAVVNNGGGKIFDRMFKDPRFQNNHSVRFDAWAKLWSLAYERWETVPVSLEAAGSRVIEILPDERATARFWKRYEAIP